LRAALSSPTIQTIYIDVYLVNTSADITIPAGKTVVLRSNGGLSVNNLEVNGTIKSEAENVTLYAANIVGEPSAEKGFFGSDDAYHTYG
jgi:hypothetical protein